MIIKERIIELSNEILEELLAFKQVHSDFTFSLRQRESTLKDEPRLSVGQWFNGSNYIYVPLFKIGDKARKVKTVGFVITFNDDASIKDNHIQISFKSGDYSTEEISFHKELAQSVGIKLNKMNFGHKFYDDPEEWKNNLHDFLNNFRPLALKILAKYNLKSKYLISENDFQKALTKVKNINQTLNLSKMNINQNTFQVFINEIINSLKDQTGVLKGISVYNTDDDYAQLKDNKDLIGRDSCHYEILLINEQEIIVEIHFEDYGNSGLLPPSKFKKEISEQLIPSGWFRNEEGKSFSIEDSFPIKIKDQDCVVKTINKLQTLESALGEEMRSIILNGKKVQHPSLNQILYGPPGTGKTYNSIKEAVRIANPNFDIEQQWKIVKDEYDKLINDGQIVFTTFHQSMDYENFIEGIKPQEPKLEGHGVTYKIEDGLFKQICKRANPLHGNFETVIESLKQEVFEDEGKNPLTIKAKGTTFDVKFTGTLVFYVQPHASAKNKPWYPVNIANIEKAFTTGNYDKVYNPTYVREILAYLEKNKGLKRGENNNHEKKNYVLIIDEINRGNVSSIFGELITLIEETKRQGKAEALSVTLPYSKEEFTVPPNLHIIGTMNTADRSVEALDTALRRRFSFKEMLPDPSLLTENELEGVNLEDLLNTINTRIETLVDRDHTIGHSFFMHIKTMDDLKHVFKDKIIPLLQEYFYGDFGKIGLVLGNSFVEKVETEVSFANFAYGDTAHYQKERFRLSNIDADDFDMRKAIAMLMNNEA